MNRVIFYCPHHSPMHRMQKLHLESLAIVLTIGQFLFKIYYQLHLLLELIVQKFYYLEDIFANRQFLFLAVDHLADISFDLSQQLITFLCWHWSHWKMKRNNILDLHKSFLAGHKKPSFLLNRIIVIIFFQLGIDLYFSSCIDPRITMHLFDPLYALLAISVLMYDVADSIAEIYEYYDY